MTQAKLHISFFFFWGGGGGGGGGGGTTVYILNRVSSKFVPSTPYELWKGEKPDLNIM